MYAKFSIMAWISDDIIPIFGHFYGFESDPFEPNAPKVTLVIIYRIQRWNIPWQIWFTYLLAYKIPMDYAWRRIEEHNMLWHSCKAEFHLAISLYPRRRFTTQ